MDNRGSRIGACWVAAAALLAGVASANAATAVGTGRITGFVGVQVVQLPDSTCTSSTAFEDMGGMTVVVTLDEAGPVVMTFHGQLGGFGTTSDGSAALRFTIDGAIVGSAIAIGEDVGSGLKTSSYTAFSGSLAAGPHTAKVLWHTFPEGSTVCAEERSLVVLGPIAGAEDDDCGCCSDDDRDRDCRGDRHHHKGSPSKPKR